MLQRLQALMISRRERLLAQQLRAWRVSRLARVWRRTQGGPHLAQLERVLQAWRPVPLRLLRVRLTLCDPRGPDVLRLPVRLRTASV